MSEKTETVKIEELRPMLQLFNEQLGRYINDQEHSKLGRTLTVIDASISDPEQRKAIKDILKSQWWNSGNYAINATEMSSPHTDIRALCEALGFELYDESNYANMPTPQKEDLGYVKKRYTDAVKTKQK